MPRINSTGRRTLAVHDIPLAEWIRASGFTDGRWHGDACGCPDDRCIGYHHDADEDCDLQYWIEAYIRDGRPQQREPIERTERRHDRTFFAR